MKILELNLHLNKPEESYQCDLLKRGSDYVLVKYVSERPGRVGAVTFDVGSTTFAYYRTGMGYVVWKMLNPDSRRPSVLRTLYASFQTGRTSGMKQLETG